MKRLTEQRLEKIARNINAMDLNYQYIDDGSKWSFWEGLNEKLNKIIKDLSDIDAGLLITMCEFNQAKYFGLIK